MKNLIDCPAEQKEWLRKNISIIDADMPECFRDSKSFINVINGEGYVRLDDYQGDSHNFVEECYMSLTADRHSYAKFLILYNQMKDLIPGCELLEYYELAANIRCLLEYMDRAIHWEAVEQINNSFNAENGKI